MKLKFISMAVAVGMVFFLWPQAGICQNTAGVSEWVEKIDQGSVNWTAGYIEAAGIGAPPDKSTSNINTRPMAFRAAREDACRHLSEMTKGIWVDSTSTIKDFTVESDIISTQLEGLIKGSQVVDQQYMPDGTVQVSLRIPLYGNLSQIMIPEALKKRKLTKSSQPPSVPEKAVHTGLVVDARGIGACPAMLPRIYNEAGEEIYGAFNVERESLISQGMSGYTRDLTAAQKHQRVAGNPLTVKALKTGGPGKSDLVISNDDAGKIRASVGNESFMKKCRVMIVLD
ncbi:MAG: LPP20 family lipoprotein [Smithellaceae bacterium]